MQCFHSDFGATFTEQLLLYLEKLPTDHAVVGPVENSSKLQTILEEEDYDTDGIILDMEIWSNDQKSNISQFMTCSKTVSRISEYIYDYQRMFLRFCSRLLSYCNVCTPINSE